MRVHHRTPASKLAYTAAALAVLAGAPSVARATSINASSTASGEDVALTLTPVAGAVVTIGSGPLPLVTDSSTSGYSLTNTALSASVAGLLSTGLLNVDASANFAQNAFGANADSTVDGLGISLLNVLGISATTITTSAAIGAAGGLLTPSGATTIEGLSVAGLAPFGASIMPGVNDVILNALGIKVTLNKEVLTGGSSGPEALSVNGIDITFTNVLATIGGQTGLLNGTIDIANSAASLSGAPAAVPEPPTLPLAAGALGAMAMLRVIGRKRPFAS